MMRPLNTGTVPPGGLWRYRDPETAAVIEHPYIDQVRRQAHRHRTINNLPIGTNWEIDLDDNLCRNTPTAPCEKGDSGERKLAAMAKRFATSMLNWARSGFKLVDEATLAARRLTCEGDDTHPRCPNWYNSTRYFGFGRCGKCGCYGGLKTPLATSKCPLGKWLS